MPRKVKIKNLSFLQRRRISRIREILEEIDFGQAIYDLVQGNDEFKKVLTEQIAAHFGNTGLSLIVGNTTLAITNVGATMFLNVGGTNILGHDGVNGFILIAGTTYKLRVGVGTTDIQAA